jgi:hypothetical protein
MGWRWTSSTISGSYAKLGSKPAVILVDVVAPRGRGPAN